LALEVKLGASLADRQLDDLLRVDIEQLKLDSGCRLGVLLLGPHELELSGVKDPRDRLLTRGAVQWSAVIEEIALVRFDDAATQQIWRDELFGLYLRRGAFGPRSVVRPTPRIALEALAVPLRDRVAELVGESYTVRLDANTGPGAIWTARSGRCVTRAMPRRSW
jgi:hypothetical protein